MEKRSLIVLLAINGILILLNVVVIFKIADEPKAIFIYPDDPRIDSLIVIVSKLEGSHIKLQQTYWNRHPKDRKYLIECIRAYCIDEDVAKKINLRTRIQ